MYKRQELHGAAAVVLNAPVHTEMIRELSRLVDIPIVLTVVSLDTLMILAPLCNIRSSKSSSSDTTVTA